MNRLSLLLVLLFASTSLGAAGCGFYVSGGDDDDCMDQGAPDIAPLELRNPETGQCQSFGSGGWCDSSCGPCPADAETSVEPPTWGYCYDACSDLDEGTCLATSACRAGYMDICPPTAFCELESSIEFAGCWAVDQTGPIQGSCSGLDALDCSRHDDCRAIHAGDGSTNYCTDAGCLGNFQLCVDEPAEQPAASCWDLVTCREVGPACPAGSTPAIDNGCYTGACIDLNDCETPASCDNLREDECVYRADCDALYSGFDCSCDANGCSCSEWVYDSCADV